MEMVHHELVVADYSIFVIVRYVKHVVNFYVAHLGGGNYLKMFMNILKRFYRYFFWTLL